MILNALLYIITSILEVDLSFLTLQSHPWTLLLWIYKIILS